MPIRLGQRTVTALLHTGSSLSLIQAHLVPQSEPVFRYTEVAGVYRQLHKWPIGHLTLGYNGSQYSFDIVKVDGSTLPSVAG